MSLRWLVLGAFLAVGCGSSSVFQTQADVDATTRVAALEAQVLSLRRQGAVDKVEIERLRQEIARLQGAVQTAERQAERAVIEARTADAERVVAAQRPAIEEDNLEDEVIPTTAPSPSTEAATTAPPSTATSLGPPTVVTADSQAIYDRGYTLFHQQQYTDAETQFVAFLAAEPNSDLSDNAQYWIGECRFARGDHAGALSAFTTTVDRYPQGNKVADAMVKAGKSLEQLGDRSGAIETYREVLSRFAGTAASAQASERLQALR